MGLPFRTHERRREDMCLRFELENVRERDYFEPLSTGGNIILTLNSKQGGMVRSGLI
jgi:hypothetical protein